MNKISTTKLLIAFLFLNCTIIEIFTCWITVQSIKLAFYNNTIPDFSPLLTLIGSVVTEVIGFSIYSLKSLKENQTGGIIYDLAMKEKMEEQT